MMTTATHNAYDTITERVLFVALELREKAGSVANFVQGAMQGQFPLSFRGS
jgi:hypothetical protein